MKKIAACAVLMWAIALFGTQLQAQEAQPELRANLPTATLAGQDTMRVWGFEVYHAALWVSPGFDAAAYAQYPFALELRYLRNFSGADIATRSLSEMRRQGPIEPRAATRWDAQMRAVFPDVKANDRITGIHQPGVGAVFWGNGRLLGEVRDPAFAKAFFGIWLSPQTSEPRLRTALLAQVQRVATTSATRAVPASP